MLFRSNCFLHSLVSFLIGSFLWTASNLFIYYLFTAALGLGAAHRLSLVVASGVYSLLRCTRFSLWWLLLLWSTGSRVWGFRSCDTWAQ